MAESSNTARYASGKGKASSRFQAMTARDAQREEMDRQHELTRRETARKTARRAALNRTPLPSSRPAAPAWRKYPGGRSAAISASTFGDGDVDWHGKSQLDELWENAWDPNWLERANIPQPHEQAQETYGSQRPLTAKERQYQAEKMDEIEARKRLQRQKDYAKERKAIAKYEARQKELEHYRKAQQKPKSDLKLSQEKARAIRERLNQVQEREKAWRERVGLKAGLEPMEA